MPAGWLRFGCGWPPWRGWSVLRLTIMAGLIAMVGLRLCPTVIWPSLDWGDEIYQATEPAHRLVYGTGLVTWEWVAHIRSWILPGFIAGIMLAARFVGAGPHLYLPAIATLLGAISLVPVLGVFGWCRSRYGGWHALAGAAVPALAPELVYFGARPLSEVVAAHLLAGGLFVGGRNATVWRSAGAGALLGLATALRPQILPGALLILLWPGRGNRLPASGGAMAALFMAALLDWATLGSPAASIWRYALVNLEGASASFGVQPWYYFLLAEAAIWGVALPIPVGLCLWGARRWTLPLLAAMVIITVHMAIGHKEHRFIYPALVLGAVSAGIGMADLSLRLSQRLHSNLGAALALCGCWTALSAAVWFGAGLSTLRQRAEDNLEAADYAAALPGLCGIGMGPGRDAWVPYGGYTHLHQRVPLFWPADAAAFARESKGFNLLLSETREPGYAILRCFGPVCVARRDGTCRATPSDIMPAKP